MRIEQLENIIIKITEIIRLLLLWLFAMSASQPSIKCKYKFSFKRTWKTKKKKKKKTKNIEIVMVANMHDRRARSVNSKHVIARQCLSHRAI